MNPNELKSVFFDVYKATASQDERGGRETLVGYYRNTVDARSDVKGQGFWGSDGSVESLPRTAVTVKIDGKELTFLVDSAITVYNETREERNARKEKLKMSGLSKLTMEERVALGLSK